MVNYLGGTNILHNLDKLPKLTQTITELAESINSFQRFRIMRAIRTIQTDGEQLQVWRIQRYSGIRQFDHDLRRFALDIAEQSPSTLI